MNAGSNEMYCGDCLDILPMLPAGSVNCCVTSPPYYGLRDYGVSGQIGLEQTPDQYVAKLVEVFRSVRELLADDGTLWLNLGDSYAGSTSGNTKSGLAKLSEKLDGGKRNGENWATVTEKMHGFKRPDVIGQNGLKPKDLIGIPWRVAFALQSDGWYLRQDIIWHKPNPMPESVTDRCTKAHEYIFLLSKSPQYYFDAEAVKEDVLDEYVSPEAARAKYGVVLTGSLDDYSLAVDHAATEALRAAMASMAEAAE